MTEPDKTLCPTCGGDGMGWNCPQCHGTGKAPTAEQKAPFTVLERADWWHKNQPEVDLPKRHRMTGEGPEWLCDCGFSTPDYDVACYHEDTGARLIPPDETFEQELDEQITHYNDHISRILGMPISTDPSPITAEEVKAAILAAHATAVDRELDRRLRIALNLWLDADKPESMNVEQLLAPFKENRNVNP